MAVNRSFEEFLREAEAQYGKKASYTSGVSSMTSSRTGEWGGDAYQQFLQDLEDVRSGKLNPVNTKKVNSSSRVESPYAPTVRFNEPNAMPAGQQTTSTQQEKLDEIFSKNGNSETPTVKKAGVKPYAETKKSTTKPEDRTASAQVFPKGREKNREAATEAAAARLRQAVVKNEDRAEANRMLAMETAEDIQRGDALRQRISYLDRQLDFWENRTRVLGGVGMTPEQAAEMEQERKALQAEYDRWQRGMYQRNQERTLAGLSDSEMALVDEYLNLNYEMSASGGVQYTENGEEKLRTINKDRKTLEARFGDDLDSILEYRERQLNMQRQQERNQLFQNWTQQNAGTAVLANLGSVATNALAGPMALAGAAEQLFNPNPYAYLDVNAPEFSAQNATKAIRDTTSGMILGNKEDPEFWRKAANMGYQTAMSSLDSIVAAQLGGAAGGALLGVNAATATMQEVTERGGSVEQALTAGIAAGIFECFFERFSIENFNRLKSIPTGTWKEVVKTFVTNASEEIHTELANILFDAAFLGDVSEYQTRLRELMDEYGHDEAGEHKAKAMLAWELTQRVFMAGVGGALQGLIMYPVGRAEGYFQNRKMSDLQARVMIEQQRSEGKTAEETDAFVKDRIEKTDNKLLKKALQQVWAEERAAFEGAAEETAAEAAEAATAEEGVPESGLEITEGAEEFREEQAAAATAAGEQETAETTELRAEDQTAEAGLANGTEQQYNEATNTAEEMIENGRERVLSDGSSERNAGERAGGQTGAVAETAGRDQTRSRGGSQAAQARSLQNLVNDLRAEKVSTRSLGIKTGTDSTTLTVVPKNLYTEQMTSTAARIKAETGMDVVYIVGGMEVAGRDGKPSQINAVITRDRIIIKANHLRYSVDQLANHELFHDKVRKDPGLVRTLRDQIVRDYKAEEFEKIAEAYAAALDGLYDDDINVIYEEIFADAYAGMNHFGQETGEQQDYVRGMTQTRAENRAAETSADQEDLELPTVEEEPEPVDEYGFEERDEDEEERYSTDDEGPEDRYAVQSMFHAAGLEVRLVDGRVMAMDDEGNTVDQVTDEIVEQSYIGAIIRFAQDEKNITKREADKQIRGARDLLNLMLKAQDGELVWRFAGSAVFSAVRSNSDSQYGTTIDFSTVCRKTQEMMTAMSRAMMERGRGLTKEQVIELQKDILEEGGVVPCPVCYVFSRWAGIGGILDNMARWQQKYGGTMVQAMEDLKRELGTDTLTHDQIESLRAEHDVSDEMIQARIAELEAATESNEDLRRHLYETNSEGYQDLKQEQEQLQTEKKDLNNLKKKLVKADNTNAVAEIDKRIRIIDGRLKTIGKDLKEIEKNGAPELAWLRRVRSQPGYWEQSDGKKGKGGYVPLNVLFNLDDAATFAEKYKLAWGYRTSRGPSAGKAILPYSDMRQGDLITGAASNSATGNKKFNRVKNGNFNKEQRTAIRKAISRMMAQNLIGGQRFQSTSDFRYDYALDYLQVFWELQALGGKMQTYTKIVEFAELVAAINGDVNLSVMPLNAGYEDGHLVFSSVTGMDIEAASKANAMYDNVQLILVGINDEHIRLAMQDSEETGGNLIGFIIPYHASGASINEFIADLVSNLGETFDVRYYKDYSELQNDLQTAASEVTADQKRRADLRKKVLTGKASAEYVNKNGDVRKKQMDWRPTTDDLRFMRGENKDISGRSFEELREIERAALAGDPAAIEEYESWSTGVLWDVYRKMWQNKSAKDTYGVRLSSSQASHIMPHEYWNTSVNRDEAYVNGFIFRSYCYSMGLIPRFTGYGSKGRMEYGDFSDETGYWKTLIDRPMYNNDGTPRQQQKINITNLTKEMLTPEYGEVNWGGYKVAEPDDSIARRAADRFVKRHQYIEEQNAMMAEMGERYSVDDEYMELAEDPEANEEQLQEMVDAAAEAAMPDSKIRTEDGRLRRVYHGTNSGYFSAFSMDYLGASSGDEGFFGRGFYFAYTEGEAGFYGRNVLPAYLNIVNPFNFQAELQTYNGERVYDYVGSRVLFAVNFAEKFPEIADRHYATVTDKGGRDTRQISFAELAEAFHDVYDNQDFVVEKVGNEDGVWTLMSDRTEDSYTTPDGKTIPFSYYDFQKRMYLDEEDARNRLYQTMEYLEDGKYSYLRIDSIPTIIMETDFTDALQRRGYDGVIQSEEGDEVVAFRPDQIKSADPVTYDPEGNVIPLNERFNFDRDEFRYSVDDEDYEERYSYAGERSEAADRELLETAQELETLGESAGDIYQSTGWFRGGDGKWRYEIDDTNLKFYRQGDARFRREQPDYARYLDLWQRVVVEDGGTPTEQDELRRLDREFGSVGRLMAYKLRNGDATLADIIDHPALFEAYPELEDVKVQFAELPPGTIGSYNPNTNRIALSYKLDDAPEGTLIHEIQHWIQEAEEFARGASPEMWMGKQIAKTAERTDVQIRAENLWQRIQEIEENSGFNAYVDEQERRRSAGEITDDEYFDSIDQWTRENIPYINGMYDNYWDLIYEGDELDRKINRTPMDLYLNTYGEQEARSAEERRTYTREQRSANPPRYWDEDTVYAERYSTDDDEEYQERAPGVTKLMRQAMDGVAEDFNIRRRAYRAQATREMTAFLDLCLETGTVDEAELDGLAERLWNMGGRMVLESENGQDEVRRFLRRGIRLYVPSGVQHEFSDDWSKTRINLIGVGVRPTSNVSDMGIDQYWQTLCEQFPGFFNEEETDRAEMLRTILDVARQGRQVWQPNDEYTDEWIERGEVANEDRFNAMRDNLQEKAEAFLEKAKPIHDKWASKPHKPRRRRRARAAETAETAETAQLEPAGAEFFKPAQNLDADEAAELQVPDLDEQDQDERGNLPYPVGYSAGERDDRGERWTGAMRKAGLDQDAYLNTYGQLDREDRITETEPELRLPAAGRTQEQFEEERSRAAAQETMRDYIAKADYRATDHLDDLGVKIDGSVAMNYGQAKSLRMLDAAAKATLKNTRRAERRLNLTPEEEEFAAGIAAGKYYPEDIPSRFNEDKVLDLAQFYMDERALGENMIRAQRGVINAALDDRMKRLFQNADEVVKKMPWILRINMNTPQRNMRAIFGDKLGDQINREIFDPVARNEAERIRWINKQFDQVRKFADRNGRQKSLTKQESMLVQMVIEGRAVAEQVASMEMGGAIRDAAENIRKGGNAADSAREFGLSREERDMAEAYARWTEAQELLRSDRVDSVKVEHAVEKYKELFNAYYDAVNDFLVVHGYEPIGFIKGYTPHMQDDETINTLEKVLKEFGVNTGVKELDTGLAGRTKDFRPNKRWNPYFLSRRGDQTVYDIQRAFESYVDYMSDVLYHTDDIMKLRRMSKYFRSTFSREEIHNAIDHAQTLQDASTQEKARFLRDQGVLESTSMLSPNDVNVMMDDYVDKLFDQITQTTKFGGLVMWLDNYTNLLAGKQNELDRGYEQTLGRSFLNKSNKYVGNFGLSKVAGNLSSTLNQMAQLPVTLGENGVRHTTHALLDLIDGKLRKTGFSQESDFLTSKKGEEFIVHTPWEMTQKILFTPAEFADRMLSTVTTRAAYLKGIDQGMDHEQAMRYADRVGAEIMGNRAKGSVPNIFRTKSPIMRAVNAFQIEALNSWEHVARDLPRDFREIAAKQGKRKAAMALAGVIVKALLSAFILNRISEELYGGTPAPFDLLGLTANFIASGQHLSTNNWIRKIIDDGMEKLTGERLFENVLGMETDLETADEFDISQALEDTWYNVSNDAPYIRNLSGLLGWGDETLPMPNVGEKFGDLKTSIEKNGWTSGEAKEDAAELGLEVFPAGNQINKTWHGWQTMANGGRYKGYGENRRLQYLVDDSAWNWVKALMFGNSALGETQQYYASDGKGLNKNQTGRYQEMIESGASREDALDLILGSTGETPTEQYGMIIDSNLPESEKLNQIQNVMSSWPQAYAKVESLVNQGVGLEDWYEVYTTKNTDGMKKADVMETINSLPLTAQQKDALYYYCGYAESTLDEAPWH